MSTQNISGELAKDISTKAVITCGPKETLSDIEKKIRAEVEHMDMLQYVYVVDVENKLQGVFSMRDLFSNNSEALAEDVMSSSLVTVLPLTDQETAASIAVQNNIRAMPVVKEDGTFQGVITSDLILDVLSEEHSEDLLLLGGIQKIYSAGSMFKDRLHILLVARLPWLLIGLGGGLLAALTVERFEEMLESYIILAFFLPLVVYMSDAVASQTLTIFIRAIAIDHSFSYKRYIIREMGLALLLALILGGLLFLLSFLWFKELQFSAVLGIALFSAVLVAVIVALFMTVILDFLKKDPAMGSGPFATIIIDIITIVIYFSISFYLLPFT
ncbi:MAG: magnesium transporter [Candidatus Paceibacterota bacterium]